MIGGDDLLKLTLLIADEQRAEIHDRPRHHIGRPVRRPAVGIDQDGAPIGKILRQSRADRANHMPDRVGIVVTGNADEDLHFTDRLHERLGLRRERHRWVLQLDVRRLSCVGSHR